MTYALWLVGALVAILVVRMLAPKADVDGDGARALVEAGAALVDVRSEGEFSAGHLPGAVNIPVGALQTRLAELKADEAVVVYCASGVRSARAASLLRAEGFAKVSNLGGMARW